MRPSEATIVLPQHCDDSLVDFGDASVSPWCHHLTPPNARVTLSPTHTHT